MEKLKKWLEAGFTGALVLVGLIILVPIYLVALFASFAFIGARCVCNVMAALTTIATVGYIGYVARSGIGFGSYEIAALGIMIAMLVAVGLWDLAAWALWRWKPDWLDAIIPDYDWLPEPTFPEKIESWFKKFSPKVCLVADIVLVVALIVVLAAFPFILGIEGLFAVLDFTLGITIAMVVCTLVWPVMTLIGWLPRCRTRKFDEFFCAATRNCEVVIFGKILKDDRKKDAVGEGVKPE